MNNTLFSIVIPIYNVEKYLSECLDSVINQNFDNYEIICVDDCSPDNSSSIVKKYIRKNQKIKLINHSKNQGLGGARNTGINHSNGKYIILLDSDDFLSPNTLSSLANEVTKNNYPDLILINYNEVNASTKTITPNCIPYRFNSKTFYTKNPLDYEKNPDAISAWLKICKRSIYDNFHFLIKTQAEDIPTFYLFSLANDLLIINNSYYNYRTQRPGSIITETTIKMHKGAVINTNYLIKLFEKDIKALSNTEGLTYMANRVINFGHFSTYYNSLYLISNISKSKLFYKILKYSDFSNSILPPSVITLNISLFLHFYIMKNYRTKLNLTTKYFTKQCYISFKKLLIKIYKKVIK